jgi:hypothetical protein
MTHCLFVERLTNIDFTYFDSERGLVGETLWVDVQLSGALNSDQMIWDFAEVKYQLKKAIEDCIDHKLLLPGRAKGVEVNFNVSNTVDCQLQDTQNRCYRYQAPTIAICVIDRNEITPQTLQQHLLMHLSQHPMLASILAPLKCELHLYADNNTEPYFHYSHGLKQHQGACQRIVHGHRSQLKIGLDQQRIPALERLWVHRWQDIYLGCDADFQRSFEEMGIEYDEFAYHSAEGFYQVQLPSDKVYRLPGSSTIECITAYLANKIHADYPTKDLKVQVYEGVHKGAIFSFHALANGDQPTR